MAKAHHDTEFTEYVRARSPWLVRVAFLLCGDWHQAEDLAQTAIAKLYRHWGRASRADSVDAYARRVLVNTFLTEKRAGWARFAIPTGEPSERAGPDVDLDTSLDLRAALAQLAPRQRATVVLRYYCDLTIEQTAEALGCSTGNVKSQSSRALAALRVRLDPDHRPSFEGIPS